MQHRQIQAPTHVVTEMKMRTITTMAITPPEVGPVSAVRVDDGVPNAVLRTFEVGDLVVLLVDSTVGPDGAATGGRTMFGSASRALNCASWMFGSSAISS